MLERILCSPGFTASACVVLMVVSNGHAMIRGELPVGFSEKRVLILCPVPTVRERPKALNGTLCGSVTRCRGRKVQEHDVLNGVALPIIVDKEKGLLLNDGPACAGAKLIEVIRRLQSGWHGDYVNHIVGIKRFVAVEPEAAPMQIVRSRL